ncbi:MAG: transposase [Pseudonocardiaceae bacterium]
MDFDRQQITCPQGHTSSSWNPVAQRGTDTIVISFSAITCGPCPVREQCTTSRKRRRQLTVHPREVHTAQLQAHTAQDTHPGSHLRPPRQRRGHYPPSRRRSATFATPATAACAKSTSNRCSPRSH